MRTAPQEPPRKVMYTAAFYMDLARDTGLMCPDFNLWSSVGPTHSLRSNAA